MRLYTILDKLASLKTEQYPVGMVLTFANQQDTGNLAKLYGGTWEQIGRGRVLMGVGTVEANTTNVFGTATSGAAYNIAQNVKGGCADQIVVAHTHEQGNHTHSQVAHTHVMNTHSHTQEGHSHEPSTSDKFAAFSGTLSSGGVKGTVDSTYYRPQVPKNGGSWSGPSRTTVETPSINGTVATMQSAGGGNTSGAKANILNEGVSGVNRNLPPFEAVYFYLKKSS